MNRTGTFRHVALATAAIAGFVVLAVYERRRPLRRRRESDLRHTARNLAIVAITGIVTASIERLILSPAQLAAEQSRRGLLHRIPLPPSVRTLLGVLALDYTLWWWHWMNHRIDFFWRFHLVHHIDLDLDSSTALRFHFGEMAMSVPYRAAQVLIFGVDRSTLALWQKMLITSVIFHHSNARLPAWLDRALAWIIVTPRMHGIHHSTVREEIDSNWSSLLSVWDRLHGTMRLDVPQETITIGVDGWQDPADITLPHALALPFEQASVSSRHEELQA